MDDQTHVELISISDIYLAAALMSHGYVIQTVAKTQKGTTLYGFPVAEEVREYIKQYDNGELLVQMSYAEAVDALMVEPYYWQ